MMVCGGASTKEGENSDQEITPGLSSSGEGLPVMVNDKA